MKRWDICNDRLSHFRPSRFLEIGVKDGAVGRRVQANVKWGIDPAPTSTAQKWYTLLCNVTSDQFFADRSVSLNFHCILVDGLHHADQVMRDVLHSLYHLHPKGTIVLHDCNPPDEGSQIVPRQQPHWNGDCWKVIVQLRATRPDLTVYTLDMDEGLGIVMWAPWPHVLIPDPGELTWERLVQNRKEWLGLQESCAPVWKP